MVGFHPAFSRHVRAEAKHLAKKKKLDSPARKLQLFRIIFVLCGARCYDAR